jgi:phenylalanyl-tRNA synthetase alpha chain
MIGFCFVFSSHKTYSVRQGPKFARRRKELATDLTAAMLKSGEWEQAEFKEYDLNVLGTNPDVGCLHPLMKVRAQFRAILMEMGFSEMPTNNFVESSFWNFDSLFQPQQHPARDSHDTFFLSVPERALNIPEDYCKRVQNMHENGGAGSIGYRYQWKIEEAQKNILRTHTTAVSARMLYQIANQPEFKPARLFSIDRVFRNETLDATHLAEFHQVEGLVADRNLTLGDLIGTIKIFFERIGISDVKFKPAYNPYTEPSMEIFGFSKQLDKWIEIGNSGVFRPEMLAPMGLPADVKVIAWGLSLERPTMIKYGIRNIRDLFGPKVKLNIIQNNPIARFDD